MNQVELAAFYQDAAGWEGKEVTIAGWAKSIRSSKSVGFLDLYDGSCFPSLQVVLEESQTEGFAEAVRQNVGASFEVRGALVLTPGAKQPFEFHAMGVRVLGPSASDYPLQKKRHTVEYLRSISHLRPRTNLFRAINRVRSTAAQAVHRFFEEEGFQYIHTPILTTNDCEGAGEMFRVTTLDLNNPPRLPDGAVDFSQDFFGQTASLTVSGQLEAECLAMALGKVYTFGPTFRAENSHTQRHAAEFWMIEPEFAFADLEDDMQLAERMLRFVVKRVMETCAPEMAFFDQYVETGLLSRLNALCSAEFARVSYTEAIRILQDSGQDFAFPVHWGIDLQTEHERYLTEQVFQKPVFVTDYPKEEKAFYMRLNADGKTVAAMDLLVPGVGELIGGSQREERLDVLETRMRELGMDVDAYAWYLDLRRYGTVCHAGFGLGFERLIMYLTGVSNIRDVLPFPRTPGSIGF